MPLERSPPRTGPDVPDAHPVGVLRTASLLQRHDPKRGFSWASQLLNVERCNDHLNPPPQLCCLACNTGLIWLRMRPGRDYPEWWDDPECPDDFEGGTDMPAHVERVVKRLREHRLNPRPHKTDMDRWDAYCPVCGGHLVLRDTSADEYGLRRVMLFCECDEEKIV